MGEHLTSAGFLLSNNYSQRMLQLKEKATLTLLQIHKKQKKKKNPFSHTHTADPLYAQPVLFSLL